MLENGKMGFGGVCSLMSSESRSGYSIDNYSGVKQEWKWTAAVTWSAAAAD